MRLPRISRRRGRLGFGLFDDARKEVTLVQEYQRRMTSEMSITCTAEEFFGELGLAAMNGDYITKWQSAIAGPDILLDRGTATV